MKYKSTRSTEVAKAGFCDVLLTGLAPDGGLMVPETYPQVSGADLDRWRGLSYADLAFEILSLYVSDIGSQELAAMTKRAYSTENFGTTEITPLTEVEPGLQILHLSNGPTLAFKDLAMQMLGQLFEHVLTERSLTLNILGATSGDTGSAAEYAMRGRERVRVFMLSPHGRMSEFQRAQMFSLLDENIFNIAVNGVFDDCQDMVKAVSADAAFKERYAIGAVNSINWARIVSQVVYYFKAYLSVTGSNEERVSFAVPSGNFGNVLAGHIARMMGLPIERLVVATNENNVLDEFFKTGHYRVRSSVDTFETSSPSMDISKASNFERFLFDLVQQDGNALAGLFDQLAKTNAIDLSDQWERIAQYRFVSGSSTHENRLHTIAKTWNDHQIMIDPHTADGLFVAQQYRQTGVPMICLETAQPVKFSETIREAIGIDPVMPAGQESLGEAVQHYQLMPRSTPALKTFIARNCPVS
jgi:threonine synthase